MYVGRAENYCRCVYKHFLLLFIKLEYWGHWGATSQFNIPAVERPTIPLTAFLFKV